MKNVFAILLVLAGMLVVATPAKADLTVISSDDCQKQWEYTVDTGYQQFQSKALGNSGFIDIRLQKRMDYPFLFGIEFGGSLVSGGALADIMFPLSVRAGLYRSWKVDFILAPGAAYAYSQALSRSQFTPEGSLGIQIKNFIKQGMSLGIYAAYVVTGISDFDSTRFGISLGF